MRRSNHLTSRSWGTTEGAQGKMGWRKREGEPKTQIDTCRLRWTEKVFTGRSPPEFQAVELVLGGKGGVWLPSRVTSLPRTLALGTKGSVFWETSQAKAVGTAQLSAPKAWC